ncbi:ABC transporter substrate-binding protein [Salinispira pacifica]|uniref:ABC transporter substrate-binding protein n=1 Tax=Salinispira pacifica TaxID=1307761 RepID=V5WJB5_9SPIO|nr:ABC transporter substrate-binding protein [Salinispira pacifica]AHC15922.1 hypothetical protein L21SP2_2570 [Salinispira pacifica]
MNKNIASFMLAAVFSAVLFASPSPETDGQISMAYPKTISSIPFLELAERHPGDYEGRDFTDHPQALGQLLNGEIDLLASGFTVGYTRYQAAGDIRYLFGHVWGISSIMTSSEISGLEELSGGSIYVPFEGSPIEVQISALLEELGLADEIELSYAPFPQAAGLLVQGKADAAVLVEPIASKLEASGNAFRFQTIQDSYALLSGGEMRSPQVSVFALEATAARVSDELEQLQDRLSRITAEIVEDPAYYGNKYAEYFELPAPVIQRGLQQALFDFPGEEEEVELIQLYSRIMNIEDPGAEFHTY